ncbi:unnamed protein product [Microthlaspi erraticum]|uniref:NYN domain-containing protein n=1 Tax=Microthlaspi erraticum TaxID=1685480 RepID=A0A6D2IFB6_9BRAS|nr:unnamed protein product [Microthlaspi erraticum]
MDEEDEDVSKLEDCWSTISLHPLDETFCLDGEDVEDLSNFSSYPSCYESYGHRQIRVFWDVVQYPIPTSANVKSVKTTLRAALNQMGFYSCVTIDAYGDRMNHSKDDLRDARISHQPQDEMVVDLIIGSHTHSPLNIVVIPSPDPESELHRVLKCLQKRHHQILLVKPKAHEQDGHFLFDSVESVVDCTQDLDGGKPIIKGRRMEDTTPVVKDLSSLASLFEGPERKGFVFWDVAKYSNPTRANAALVGTGIRAALQRLGHYGCVEILAFGGYKMKRKHIKHDQYKGARIIHIPQGLYVKAWDLYAKSLNPGPLMVIPTPDPCSDQHRLLTSFLKEGHYDVLSVKPPVDEDSPQDESFLTYPDSILGCTYGLYGGYPILRGRIKDERYPRLLQFEQWARGGVFVFWNLEDFPFPAGWSPDAIYEKIEAAYSGADGYELGDMSIWAYIDDKEGSWGGDFLKNKTWESSIYFLPGGGDKSARRNRMLHDILLWSRDMVTTSAKLVIVSNKDEVIEDKDFSSRLEMLEGWGYKVFVQPGSSFF